MQPQEPFISFLYLWMVGTCGYLLALTAVSHSRNSWVISEVVPPSSVTWLFQTKVFLKGQPSTRRSVEIQSGTWWTSHTIHRWIFQHASNHLFNHPYLEMTIQVTYGGPPPWDEGTASPRLLPGVFATWRFATPTLAQIMVSQVPRWMVSQVRRWDQTFVDDRYHDLYQWSTSLDQPWCHPSLSLSLSLSLCFFLDG